MPGCGRDSPLKSLSMPAMMRSTVDLPAPLSPSRPILAPGKNDSEMSLMIWRFGGTVLLTPFMVKMYCDMGAPEWDAARSRTKRAGERSSRDGQLYRDDVAGWPWNGAGKPVFRGP